MPSDDDVCDDPPRDLPTEAHPDGRVRMTKKTMIKCVLSKAKHDIANQWPPVVLTMGMVTAALNGTDDPSARSRSSWAGQHRFQSTSPPSLESSRHCLGTRWPRYTPPSLISPCFKSPEAHT